MVDSRQLLLEEIERIEKIIASHGSEPTELLAKRDELYRKLSEVTMKEVSNG